MEVDQVFLAVRRLGEAMDRFDQAASAALGIHRSDLRALNALERGPRSAGDLAEALQLTTGSVTALINRLEAAGYVVRLHDPTDRRRVEVELTPQTFAAFARVYRPCGAAVRTALATIDARQLADAAHVMDHVTNAVTAEADQQRTAT